MSRHIVQRLPPLSSPLLPLRHVTPLVSLFRFALLSSSVACSKIQQIMGVGGNLKQPFVFFFSEVLSGLYIERERSKKKRSHNIEKYTREMPRKKNMTSRKKNEAVDASLRRSFTSIH